MKRAIGWMMGLFAAGVLLDRARLAARARTSVKKMVPDFVGNYDLDGVSYDDHHKKVVVGSDSRVKEPTLQSGAHQLACAEQICATKAEGAQSA